MPKKVLVLVRTLEYGSHLFGKNGTYTMTDFDAVRLAREGKVKIVEDLGTDETTVIDVVDHAFLKKIEFHAEEIFEILNRVVKNKMEKEREIVDAAFSKGSEGQGPSDDEASKNDKSTDPSSTPGSLENSGNDSNIVPNDDIPEDFPGYKDLAKKNIVSMKALKDMDYDALIAAGITSRTASNIGARLAELDKK